jgi:hypothetical protein
VERRRNPPERKIKTLFQLMEMVKISLDLGLSIRRYSSLKLNKGGGCGGD